MEHQNKVQIYSKEVMENFIPSNHMKVDINCHFSVYQHILTVNFYQTKQGNNPLDLELVNVEHCKIKGINLSALENVKAELRVKHH